MECLNNNTTSSETLISSCYNFTNHNNSVRKYLYSLNQNLKMVDWVTMGIGLPLTLIVIVAILLQVKKDQGVPVFVINLLFSDLIQFCGRILNSFMPGIGYAVTQFGLMASVGFMICISLERYLVIAKPLWYKFRRNIKTYVVVCAVVWTLPLPVLLTLHLNTDHTVFQIVRIIILSLLLLPFPFFIFFFVGTIKALSGALSVPAEEKRRIAAIQVVVLLIYTLLFLPIILFFLSSRILLNHFILVPVCIFLSPLADTTLYLLTRKSFLDNFLASLCSCKASDNQKMRGKETESMTTPNTETV